MVKEKYVITEAHRAKLNEAANKPEARAKMAATAKETNKRPEVKKRRSEAMKEVSSRSGMRAKMAATAKETNKRPEVKKRRSEAMKEVSKRPEVKKKQSKRMSGEKNIMFGEKHTDEANEKNRLKHIGKCHSQETKIKMSESQKIAQNRTGVRDRKSATLIEYNKNPEVKKKQSKRMSGKNNPSYKDGSSSYPYCFAFNARRKRAVRDFFGGYCLITGMHQNDCLRKHSVHHVDHDKEQGCNGKPFNLVPMVESHNSKEQRREEEYKTYINNTLREGFKWGIWSEEEYKEKVMYAE